MLHGRVVELLQPNSGSEPILALKLLMEDTAASNPSQHTVQHNRGFKILCDKNRHRADSKGALGEEPCWLQEPSRHQLSGFVKSFRMQNRCQAWSRGQRAEGVRGGSWELSSTRQATLPKDALSQREGCSKKAK